MAFSLLKQLAHAYRNGIRIDSGVEDGSVVGVHYDPMLAKIVAHAARAQKRRIPHDVIRLRPFGAPRVHIVEKGDGGGFVGDEFSGDGVLFGGVAVPDG